MKQYRIMWIRDGRIDKRYTNKKTLALQVVELLKDSLNRNGLNPPDSINLYTLKDGVYKLTKVWKKVHSLEDEPILYHVFGH